MRRLKHLTHWLSDVAAAAIAAMILVTIADVLMKNFFNRPIRGAFELVEFLLVVTVFCGIAEVFRSESNICVDIADQVLNERPRAILKTFGAFSSVVFLLLLGWAMLRPAGDTITFPQWTQELGIPFYVFWIPILAGTAIAIVAAIAVSWTYLRARPSAGEG